MKTSCTATLAMLAGCTFGAVAVEGLHAQAKPPIYYVVEIDTTDSDAYAKSLRRRLRPSSKQPEAASWP